MSEHDKEYVLWAMLQALGALKALVGEFDRTSEVVNTLEKACTMVNKARGLREVK